MAAPKAKPAPKPAPKPKAKGGGSKSSGPSFLLQHGERVGLAGAGVLVLLMLATSLFWPGSGFGSGSPEEKASELKSKSDSIAARLNDTRNNVPGDGDKPPKDSDKKRIQLDKQIVLAEKFALDRLADTATSSTLGRRVPTVFPVAEALATVARVQLKTYILTKKDGKDAIVGIKGGTGKAPAAMAGMFGGSGRPPGGAMGKRILRGMAMPGIAPQMMDDSRKDKTTVTVALDRLDKEGAGMTPAVQIRPRRLAVLAASFPYKKQVEEFRARLGLRSAADVLNEPSMELAKDKDKKGKYVGGSSFRFLGVVVERRELDGDNKPVGDGKWVELDLAEDYRELLKHAGRELEEEVGDIAKVSFTGLVMPKIKQFRPEDYGLSASGPGMTYGGASAMRGPTGFRPPPAGPGDSGEPAAASPKTTPSQYPPVETELQTIAATLKAMEGKKSEDIGVPKTRFTGDDFNPFGPAGGSSRPKEGDMGMPAPPIGPKGPTGPMDAMTSQEAELPEYCLVRAIDVNVEPGKAYEYRMKVRMGNPNADRRDVANPMYAEARELESPWSEMPLKVAVTPELMYFAVDQKEVDRKPLTAQERIDPVRQIVLQGHRWLTNVTMSTGGELIIGDWAVAERIAVYRGEYVGRDERIEMPAWRYTAEAYVMADDGSKRKTIPVPFGFKAKGGQPEAILVDFERGERGYKRAVPKGEGKFDLKEVPDRAAAQVVLLNPDGRLVLREGAYDTSDPDRSQRLADFRKRVAEVKKAGSKPAGGGGFDK